MLASTDQQEKRPGWRLLFSHQSGKVSIVKHSHRKQRPFTGGEKPESTGLLGRLFRGLLENGDAANVKAEISASKCSPFRNRRKHIQLLPIKRIKCTYCCTLACFFECGRNRDEIISSIFPFMNIKSPIPDRDRDFLQGPANQRFSSSDCADRGNFPASLTPGFSLLCLLICLSFGLSSPLQSSL